jgi:hypothetical protein
MHGPDAARIMREELNYRGAIIGLQTETKQQGVYVTNGS